MSETLESQGDKHRPLLLKIVAVYQELLARGFNQNRLRIAATNDAADTDYRLQLCFDNTTEETLLEVFVYDDYPLTPEELEEYLNRAYDAMTETLRFCHSTATRH